MLDILFVTDYVCPFCIVAKEALKQALKATGQEAKITIAPMELTEVTKEPVDTYHDPERKAHYQVLFKPARELGLDMKFPPHIVPRPYTKNAFEGRFYAISQNKEEEYNDLMYKAYFIEEKDIGDMDVLCELVQRIGLDPAEYRNVIESGLYEENQKACNTFARKELKVEGVPTIYLNGKQIEPEEYSTEEFVSLISDSSK